MNKAFLFGRIGKTPDLRFTPAGTAVATASMATTERYTDATIIRQDQKDAFYSKIAITDNNAAAKRARKITLDMEKLMKQYRKESV